MESAPGTPRISEASRTGSATPDTGLAQIEEVTLAVYLSDIISAGLLEGVVTKARYQHRTPARWLPLSWSLYLDQILSVGPGPTFLH